MMITRDASGTREAGMPAAGVEMRDEGAPGWASRAVLGALWLGAAIAAANYAITVARVFGAPLIDFDCFLDAAHRVAKGEPLYVFMAYRYPPPLALLLTPLTFVSVTTAQNLWTLANQVFLGVGIWLSLRLLGRRLDRFETPLLVALVFSYFPLFTQLKLGQLGALLFLLHAGMAESWYRGRRGTAAALIAFAGALKIYSLGMAVWFARQGSWRSILFVGAALAAILFAPDWLFGHSWTRDFVEALPHLFSWGVDPLIPDNSSFYGVAARFAAVLGLRTGWASLAVGGLAAAAALAVALLCTPTGAMRGDVIAISVTAAALPVAWANPIGWSHNFLFVLLALPALLVRLGDRLRERGDAADVAAVTLALASWLLVSQPYRLPRLLGHDLYDAAPLSVLLRSTFVCGSVGLWLVMLRELLLAGREETVADSGIEVPGPDSHVPRP